MKALRYERKSLELQTNNKVIDQSSLPFEIRPSPKVIGWSWKAQKKSQSAGWRTYNTSNWEVVHCKHKHMVCPPSSVTCWSTQNVTCCRCCCWCQLLHARGAVAVIIDLHPNRYHPPAVTVLTEPGGRMVRLPVIMDNSRLYLTDTVALNYLSMFCDHVVSSLFTRLNHKRVSKNQCCRKSARTNI